MSLTFPYTLTNGQTADANQVMANFNAVSTFLAGSVATAGANFNITSINGLSTPLSVPQGGTGASTGAGAISNLGGVAASNNGTDFSSPALTLTNLGGVAKANNGSDFANIVTTRNNLLPSQAGNAGQILTTNGVNVSWVTPLFVVPTAQFRNQQTSGTASGEALGGSAWTQRTLNTTMTNTITGASLAANQFTLPAGTYEVTATGQMRDVSSTGGTINHRLRVRNITDGVTMVVGQNCGIANNGTTIPTVVNATLEGQFTINAPKVLELDSWVNGSGSSGGVASSSGEPEVYCDIYLWKVQ